MAKHLGYADKLYYGTTAGTTAATEAEHVENVKITYESDDVDVTDRASAGWKSHLQGLKDSTLTFSVYEDSSDAFYIALYTKYAAGLPIPLKAVDNAGIGIDADWSINSMEADQTNPSAGMVAITCKPNTDLRVPTINTTPAT